MLGLHAKHAGQRGDDAKLKHFQKAAHDGRDVARIADGHKEAEISHVPAVPLGGFIRVGFLPEDAPAVLGIEQGHAIIFGQQFNHLHAVVKHAGQFKHGCSAAQGLRKLLGRHLAVGQKHHALEGRAHV